MEPAREQPAREKPSEDRSGRKQERTWERKIKIYGEKYPYYNKDTLDLFIKDIKRAVKGALELKFDDLQLATGRISREARRYPSGLYCQKCEYDFEPEKIAQRTIFTRYVRCPECGFNKIVLVYNYEKKTKPASNQTLKKILDSINIAQH